MSSPQSRLRSLLLHQVDHSLGLWRAAELPEVPKGGWISSIRRALGMSAATLGARVGMTEAGLRKLESAEVRHAITLASLQKVAEALDCEVRYALVPRESLQITIERCAMALAESEMRSVAHTMVLEQQGVSAAATKKQIERRAQELRAAFEVVAIKLDAVPGQTPLDPDELGGLKPKHLSNQAQLNEWEQNNISEGSVWAHRKLKRSMTADLLEEAFVRALHKRMFNATWSWAGAFRTTNKTIGVESQQIAVRLRQLLENAKFWIDNKTFPTDELALRFHRDLVWIHPFPNGNGRHSRLMAELVAISLGAKRFSWGSNANLVNAGGSRDAYIAALRAADEDDYGPLQAFSRS